MSDSRKQTLGILTRISEFLETLPEEHLADLESGPLGPPSRCARRQSRARPLERPSRRLST